MDFPNKKIERHLDQDHSVLPRGRQAVSFLTFMSSSLVKEKTAARLILTPGIYQCQPHFKKTLEILEKCGDCWTSKEALAGKMSYCSSFNLLVTIHCLQHGARRLHRLSGGGISKIVFWNQDFVFCIWYLVTSLCMDKVEQGRRVQRD